MGNFRKSFRGYRVSEVDERLRELEAELEKANSRCEMLQGRLDEAAKAADTAKEALAEKNAELERAEAAYDKARRKADKNKNSAESIGRIYIKAFESGKELANAPTQYIKEYFDGIENASEEARRGIFAAKKDFAGVSEKIAAAVEDIKNQADFLSRKLSELSAGAESVDSAYARFGAIKSEAEKEMSEIVRRYEASVGDYVQGTVRADRTQQKEADEGFLGEEQINTQSAAEQKTEPAAEAGAVHSVSEPNNAIAADDSQKTAGDIADIDGDEAASHYGESNESEADADDSYEEKDTLSDFSDEPESAAENSSPDTVQAKAVPDNDFKRGQSILDLLNKYKKQ